MRYPYPIIAFAADPQWKLEGRPGLLTILHTWSQTLIDHFHIHCLIPAGVRSFDGRTWNPSNDKFLFRVQSLADRERRDTSREFKKQYLAMITASPEQVLEYLGRYTHRIAISNHRIKSIDNGKVTFTYRDRQNDNKLKDISLWPHCKSGLMTYLTALPGSDTS